MSARIRIAVIDREPMFRLGVELAFSSRRFQIVGKGYGSHRLPEIMDQIRPDVLIADQLSAAMMLDAVGAATSRFQTRIVILTDDDISPHHAGLIRDLGVLAILGRDATPREVQAAFVVLQSANHMAAKVNFRVAPHQPLPLAPNSIAPSYGC